MREERKLSYHWTVQEILDQYPQVMPIFIEIGLLCVGCPAESFHSLADVARENHLDLQNLMKRIRHAVEQEI